jgi:hypothetical protein
MRARLLVILLLITLINGCGGPAAPNQDDMEKFITDSEEILSTLSTAFEQGRRLNYDEERKFVEYTVDYDKESEFQKAADNPSISLVVTSAAMMELQLGENAAQSIEDFKNYKSEFEIELAAVKAKVLESK